MRGIYAYVVCVICLHTRADALKIHRCQHHASIRQNASWPEPREHSVDSCIHDTAPIRGTYLTVLETHMLQLIRHMLQLLHPRHLRHLRPRRPAAPRQPRPALRRRACMSLSGADPVRAAVLERHRCQHRSWRASRAAGRGRPRCRSGRGGGNARWKMCGAWMPRAALMLSPVLASPGVCGEQRVGGCLCMLCVRANMCEGELSESE